MYINPVAIGPSLRPQSNGVSNRFSILRSFPLFSTVAKAVLIAIGILASIPIIDSPQTSLIRRPQLENSNAQEREIQMMPAQQSSLKLDELQPSKVETISKPISIRAQIIRTAVLELQKMNQNMQEVMARPTKSNLQRGAYYSNQYYEALKQTNQKKIIEEFRERGDFFHGYSSQAHFTHLPGPTDTQKLPMAYRIKPGIKSSDALRSYQNSLTFTDCGNACAIGMYHALLNVWGEEKFNRIFSSSSKTPLVISTISPSDSLRPLYIPKTVPDKRYRVGEIVHFSNIQPQYNRKHRQGEGAGFNVVCSDANPKHPKFVGFGLPVDGASPQQIEQLLLDEYNKIPLADKEILPSWLASHHSQEVYSPMTLNQFKELGGGKVVGVIGFNYDLIEKMAKVSPEEGAKLYANAGKINKYVHPDQNSY